MTMAVRELLSQVGLDMSEHASGNSTPKRLEPMVLVTPLPIKLEDFPWPVDTSFQVSTPDDAEMEDASLEEIPTASSLTAKTPGPSGDAPPLDAAHLWEEANKALGELLAIKSSTDAHRWKLVLDLGMALHQNETAESIKEAKAICAHSIQEAKTHCSTAIREVEAWGASQAGSFQQSDAKTVQHLEEEAIEEESKVNSTSSLPVKLAYELALPNSVVCWKHFTTYSWDMHQCPILLAFPKELPPPDRGPPPGLLPLLHLSIHLDASGSITPQTQQMSHLPV